MPTKEALIFTVTHGDTAVDYTDWPIARSEAERNLREQWTSMHGAPANSTEATRRAITIETTIWNAIHGDARGIHGIRLALATTDTASLPEARLLAAEKATEQARARLAPSTPVILTFPTPPEPATTPKAA